MRDIAAALVSLGCAAGAVYLLYLAVREPGSENFTSDSSEGKRRATKSKSRQNRKRNKSKPSEHLPVNKLKSLRALSARCDSVVASSQSDAEKIILLEQIQLACDAIGGNPKRKQRRKQLNLRIEELISRLESHEKDNVVIETVETQKGYKKRKDGSTTSYFDRDIDDKAKLLMGSCMPKRILDNEAVKEKNRTLGSAWNAKGQTWEDKTIAVSKWKKILCDTFNGSIEGVENLSYSLSWKDTTGDVMMKVKNKSPAFIFDITIKLLIQDADSFTVANCTVDLMSGDDDCTVSFDNLHKQIKKDWNSSKAGTVSRDITRRTAAFEEKLKECVLVAKRKASF